MLGKLRLRLSSLRPDQVLSADLPLLSDRLKGAKAVASLQLSVQVSFVDRKASSRGGLTTCLRVCQTVWGEALVAPRSCPPLPAGDINHLPGMNCANQPHVADHGQNLSHTSAAQGSILPGN